MENSSYSQLNTVTIDLNSLRCNIREIKRFIGESVQILPVVKSDAYGHGMVEVSRVIEEEGVWGLAVFDLIEAQKLRKNGIKSKIFLLSGIYPLIPLIEIPEDVVFGITNFEMLSTLDKLSKFYNRHFEAHLKVDIGMSRFGFNREEVKEIISNRKKLENISINGIYSHLPCADSDRDRTFKHMVIFDNLIRELKFMGWQPKTVHLANSSGFINFNQSHYNLIRPGLAIYGIYPSSDMIDKISLYPVMQFKSRIIEIKRINRGACVSYGATYKASRDLKIGIIPVGYDDGYMRSLSNNENKNTHVLVNGKRCEVLGRICMKATIINLNDIDGVNIGDEVVLFGRQGGEFISVDELAHKANTISYELLCLIGSRNKRVFYF